MGNRGCRLRGEVRSFPEAFELEQRQWLEGRCGTARAKIEESIRAGFESEFMGTGGRWDCEKLRTILAEMHGARGAAAPAPMAMGD